MHSFTAICTKKLQNKISEQWYSDISGSEGPLHNQSSKLRFYKLFKTSFHREPYLDFVSDFKGGVTLNRYYERKHTNTDNAICSNIVLSHISTLRSMI